MLRASLGGCRRKDLFQRRERISPRPIQNPRPLEMLFGEQAQSATATARQALGVEEAPHDPPEANDRRWLNEGFVH